MKKILALIIVMVMLCSCAQKAAKPVDVAPTVTPTVTPTARNMSTEENTEWKSLFLAFLVSLNEKMANNLDSIYYITLNDLTLDGIPELIVSDSVASAAYGFAIYQIIENQVECVWGYSSVFDQLSTKYHDNTSDDFYSGFDDFWLTLSKNKKSGEYKYIFTTANGSSEDSFGSIYSASTDESTGILKITPEFSYVDFIETDDDIHQVKGQDTTKENYDKLTGEFFDTWENTGYLNSCMVSNEHYNFLSASKKMPLSFSNDSIEKYFDLYHPEPLN